MGATEIQDRPILRSGEILETIPGMIITQHAGGGKANQYFLRGFNLDHGTDFAVYLDSMPLNLPSHAHGEGYADMNAVTPEFVERIDFEKGPYYASIGNYGSAGAANLVFFKTLPENFVLVEGGMYGYGRIVFGISKKLRKGNLLYGGEAYHDNGPWTTHEDNYYKFNGLATYSQGGETNGFSITARAYRGTWNSSDQIPVNAVPLVGFYGALNPTDGGESQRYSLQGEWHRRAQIPRRKSRPTDFITISIYFPISLTTWMTPLRAISSNSRTGAGWRVLTHTTRFSAHGLATRWQIRSACRCATIGSTTAFTARRTVCARTRMISTPAMPNPSPSAIPIGI